MYLAKLVLYLYELNTAPSKKKGEKMARIDCYRPYSAEKRCMHNRDKTLKFIAKEF